MTQPVTLRTAVQIAERTFSEYAKLHAAKHTQDGNVKAARNKELAEMCNLALTETPVAHRNALNALRDDIHARNVAAGWWSDLQTGERIERNDGEMIALMHSELSEGLEGVRKSKMDDHLPHRPMVEVEMADTIIRILDYCGGRGLDIGGALVEKLAYNAQRADHKRENRAKPDGKKI